MKQALQITCHGLVIHSLTPQNLQVYKFIWGHLRSQGSKGNFHTHTPLLVKRVNWGYLYTPIQTGTFECGYTPAYWGYTKYECDYTPITWGYPNTPSIGDMLLNAFIWHFRSHAGNAQMGTSPVGSVSTFPLAESDVCPRFTPFTNAPPHLPVPAFKVRTQYTHVCIVCLSRHSKRGQICV